MQVNNIISNILRKNQPWAVLPETIDAFLSTLKTNPEMLAVGTQSPQNVVSDPYEVVDDNAIITIRGVIFAEENCQTMIGIGTSNDYIQSAIQLASEDPSINRIILDISTPGGEVAKTDATAKLIREVRQNKEIIAVVEDLAASAGYWIASSASKIVIAETGAVGSIGVRAVIEDDSKALESEGIYRYSYISNQSPLKDFNPDSKESIDDLQRQLDYLASIFIQSVALGRSTDVTNVSEYYGKGGIIYGREAVRLGMVDEIGTLSSVLKSLRPTINSTNQNGGSVMQTQTQTVDVESLRSESIQAERERITKLMNLPVNSADEKALVMDAVSNGFTAEQIAIKLLSLRDAKEKNILESRQSDAKQIPVVESMDIEKQSSDDGIEKIANMVNRLNAIGGVK